MEYAITSAEQLKELWTDIYDPDGKPDWSGILPYYDDDILFRDAVQATVEAISSLGFTLTPDKEIWVYVALAALCLERILFGRARGKE